MPQLALRARGRENRRRCIGQHLATEDDVLVTAVFREVVADAAE